MRQREISIAREDRANAVVIQVDGAVRQAVRIVEQAPNRIVIAARFGDDQETAPPLRIADGSDVLVALPSGGWMLGTAQDGGDGHVRIVQVTSIR